MVQTRSQKKSKIKRFFMLLTKVFTSVQWKNYPAIDPITLEKIEGRPFVLVNKDCGVFMFDAITLSSYILESGDSRNPITRDNLSTTELKRLAKLAGHSFTRFQRKLEAKKRRKSSEIIPPTEFFANEIARVVDSICERCTEETQPGEIIYRIQRDLAELDSLLSQLLSSCGHSQTLNEINQVCGRWQHLMTRPNATWVNKDLVKLVLKIVNNLAATMDFGSTMVLLQMSSLEFLPPGFIISSRNRRPRSATEPVDNSSIRQLFSRQPRSTEALALARTPPTPRGPARRLFVRTPTRTPTSPSTPSRAPSPVESIT